MAELDGYAGDIRAGIAAQREGADQEPSPFKNDSTAAACERLFDASGFCFYTPPKKVT